MNLTQRQLELFVTTARLCHLTRAASALHLTQPALSRALADFESRLGIRLFDRSSRRLSLSHEGQRFLPVAIRLLRDMADAVDGLRDTTAALRGQVTIATGTAFGTTVLPGVLQTFCLAHPGVRLRVIDDNSEGITRRVIQGDADLGVGSPIGDTAGLICRPLLDAPLGVLAHPDHVRLGSRCSPGRLASLTLLKEPADTSIMQLLHSHGSDLVARMEAGIEVSSLALQMALAQAGVGAAVVSALGASHPAAAGLRFSALQPTLRRTVHLMHRRNASIPPSVRSFIDHLVSRPRTAGLHAAVRWLASSPG